MINHYLSARRPRARSSAPTFTPTNFPNSFVALSSRPSDARTKRRGNPGAAATSLLPELLPNCLGQAAKENDEGTLNRFVFRTVQ